MAAFVHGQNERPYASTAATHSGAPGPRPGSLRSPTHPIVTPSLQASEFVRDKFTNRKKLNAASSRAASARHAKYLECSSCPVSCVTASWSNRKSRHHAGTHTPQLTWFWVDCRQTFPYRIMEGLPVIREQPEQSLRSQGVPRKASVSSASSH